MFYVNKAAVSGKRDTFLLHVVPAMVVFVVCVILAIIAYNTATSTVRREQFDMLTTQNNQVANFIQRRMEIYENILRGGAGLFYASDEVTRQDWTHYVENYDLDNRYPGILGIGFAQLLPKSELSKHIERIRSEGFAEYALFPAGDREIYASVVYIEPFEGVNLRAFGYDMYSEPTRRRAMDTARDTGASAMSDIVTLLQEDNTTDTQPGFLLYSPLYSGDRVPDDIQQRRNQIIGFVFAPFRSGDLIERVLTAKSNGYSFRLYNRTHDSNELIYQDQEYDTLLEHNHIRVAEEAIDMPGARWVVEGVATTAIVPSTIRNRPYTALVGIILFACILASFVYLLLKNRTRGFSEREENEIQQAKDELLALASHQLRTPATGVKQYIGMLREGFAGQVTPMQQKLLDKAYESNERQLETINEMLFVARTDAGHLNMDFQPTDMKRLVSEITEELLPSIQRRHQQCLIKLPPKPVKAEVDRQYMRMAIENIITNASKYTRDEGKIIIELSQTNRKVTFQVVDTGVGVSKRDQELLFKKFSRIPNELTNQVSGSGIGLHLVKKVVDAHHGQVTFVSEPGKGSAVTIVVPKIFRQPTRFSRDNAGM